MARLKCQVIRDGASKWMIWKLSDGFDVDGGEGREYEQIARVVFDKGAYYVELPIWGSDGIDGWDRQPRPWTLKDGAVHSVTHPRKAMAS